MARKTKRDLLNMAKKAHTDLCLFDAIVSMVEGGGFGPDSQTEQFAVIGTCKRAMAKCMARMDHAERQLGLPHPRA